MEIFGFEITRKKEELRDSDVEKNSAPSFVAPTIDDGTAVIPVSYTHLTLPTKRIV